MGVPESLKHQEKSKHKPTKMPNWFQTLSLLLLSLPLFKFGHKPVVSNCFSQTISIIGKNLFRFNEKLTVGNAKKKKTLDSIYNKIWCQGTPVKTPKCKLVRASQQPTCMVSTTVGEAKKSNWEPKRFRN